MLRNEISKSFIFVDLVHNFVVWNVFPISEEDFSVIVCDMLIDSSDPPPAQGTVAAPGPAPAPFPAPVTIS